MSATQFSRVTTISTKEYTDYLPRVLTVLQCVADSVGVDDSATQSAHELLAELGEDSRLACGPLSIAFSAEEDCVLTELIQASPVESAAPPRNRAKLRRWITESVELIKNTAGFTIRLMKNRGKSAVRISAIKPSSHHRN